MTGELIAPPDQDLASGRVNPRRQFDRDGWRSMGAKERFDLGQAVRRGVAPQTLDRRQRRTDAHKSSDRPFDLEDVDVKVRSCASKGLDVDTQVVTQRSLGPYHDR